MHTDSTFATSLDVGCEDLESPHNFPAEINVGTTRERFLRIAPFTRGGQKKYWSDLFMSSRFDNFHRDAFFVVNKGILSSSAVKNMIVSNEAAKKMGIKRPMKTFGSSAGTLVADGVDAADFATQPLIETELHRMGGNLCSCLQYCQSMNDSDIFGRHFHESISFVLLSDLANVYPNLIEMISEPPFRRFIFDVICFWTNGMRYTNPQFEREWLFECNLATDPVNNNNKRRTLTNSNSDDGFIIPCRRNCVLSHSQLFSHFIPSGSDQNTLHVRISESHDRHVLPGGEMNHQDVTKLTNRIRKHETGIFNEKYRLL